MVFDVLIYAAELISLTMGLSIAMVFDPMSENQSTSIGQVLSILVLAIFLTFDGDHLILLFAQRAIDFDMIGQFNFSQGIINYILAQMKNFFILGFSMAFPVLAIGLLTDIIFGMLMKNIPQFNLLVLGFPIKIGLSILTIIVVLGGIIVLFKNQFLSAYNALAILFGSGKL